MASKRSASSDGPERPTEIWGPSASAFWVAAASEFDDAAPSRQDPFLLHLGCILRFFGGEWKRFPTFREADHLSRRLGPLRPPAVREARRPEGPDMRGLGARLVPLFWGAKTTAPDLKALEGKIAWTHQPDTADYAVVVDRSGPVYVFLRALDLSTKRPTFGVVRCRRSRRQDVGRAASGQINRGSARFAADIVCARPVALPSVEGRRYIDSSTSEMPCPPPMHIVTSP